MDEATEFKLSDDDFAMSFFVKSGVDKLGPASLLPTPVFPSVPSPGFVGDGEPRDESRRLVCDNEPISALRLADGEGDLLANGVEAPDLGREPSKGMSERTGSKAAASPEAIPASALCAED